MPANILARAANKLTFAHLSGVSGKKSEEKDEDKKAEDDENEKKDQDREDGDARRAEEKDDEKDKASAEEDKDGDEDEKKTKKSKSKKADDEEEDASAEDDDDDEEMRGKSAAASARRRERARCAAIFSAPGAAKNVQLAATLAFNTMLSRKEAVEVLQNAPAGTSTHSGRADRNPKIGSDTRTTPNSEQAIAASWDTQMAKHKRK